MTGNIACSAITVTILISPRNYGGHYSHFQVSRAERADAELYYIHYVDHLQHSHPGTASKWGRYDELVRKHGPGEKAAAPKATTLKSKMISASVCNSAFFLLALLLLFTSLGGLVLH